MSIRIATVLAGLAAVAMLMTGCGVGALPTYETVRAETRAAMQRVADELPASSRVSRNPANLPYPCGDGVMFTAQWTFYIDAGFDATAFIRTLPESLGSDFEEVGTARSGDESVYLRATAYGGTGVGVSDYSDDEQVVIEILATSRCAEPPVRR